MANNQTNDGTRRIAIDFIDPLFAVVISISFFEVMERQWFTPSSINDLFSSAFDIFALLLGYLTVVLSWVFYHLSIRAKPIKIETRPGFWRFIFDILLLSFYWILLVKFENFWLVLLMLAVIYWVFVIWDQLKWWEYKKSDNSESRRRRGVSTLWALVFTVVFVLYWLLPNACDWIFLILAFIATVLYRVHKNHLSPTLILDLLAFSKPERKAHT